MVVPNRKLTERDCSSEDDNSDRAGDIEPQRSFASQREIGEFERRRANALLANPLRGYTHAQLRVMGREFALEHALVEPEDLRAFELGAVLASNSKAWVELGDLLHQEEQDILMREVSSRWSNPKLLYLVIALCSTCAAVQGMDETVVNGAQLGYTRQFGIADGDSRSSWLTGLLNSAPYLCCALVGCWLTIPMNNLFGRRGTIFLTCMFSALACLWQSFTNSWWAMFVARFSLGLGIGPKSATVPIYAAECTPPNIRGGLVMQWQMWTAFGIMLGYFADLAFINVKGTLAWRLMLGSAMLPALICLTFVFLAPESPRWYISKGRIYDAYESLCRLRFCKVQAARDLFAMFKGLEAEASIRLGQGAWKEVLTVPRNRRALIASELVMFMQQFCGVNVIAYYSSTIFKQSGFDEASALGASAGFGVINFLFAIPAVFAIDKFGRRPLLLITFPLMAAALLLTGFSFWFTNATARLSCVAVGIYLYGMFYSPGMGPVPLLYSAESQALYVRTWGMSVATATLWFFNFILSVTWPSLERSFKPQGAFGWYAAWNIIGWIGALTIMPETKGYTLEELDAVFNVPTRQQVTYGLRQVPWFIQRYILRRDVQPPPPLVNLEKSTGNVQYGV